MPWQNAKQLFSEAMAERARNSSTSKRLTSSCTRRQHHGRFSRFYKAIGRFSQRYSSRPKRAFKLCDFW